MTRQYSEKFKARMVQRMMGAGAKSANALSMEVGIGQPTLSRWLREAARVGRVSDDDDRQEPQRRPDDWSPEEKLAAVMEAAGISEQDLGAWLRRKGLTEDHLSEWRELALEGVAARPARPDPEERKRVKALEKELQRKEKALAETAALLVLQGKMQALWEERDNPTGQKSDVQPWKPSGKRKKRGPR